MNLPDGNANIRKGNHNERQQKAEDELANEKLSTVSLGAEVPYAHVKQKNGRV